MQIQTLTVIKIWFGVTSIPNMLLVQMRLNIFWLDPLKFKMSEIEIYQKEQLRQVELLDQESQDQN